MNVIVVTDHVPGAADFSGLASKLKERINCGSVQISTAERQLGKGATAVKYSGFAAGRCLVPAWAEGPGIAAQDIGMGTIFERAARYG